MKNIPDFFSKIDEPIFDPSTIPLLILSRFAKKILMFVCPAMVQMSYLEDINITQL